MPEKPHEIYLNTCQALAKSMQPLEFEYTKSRQRLRRSRAPFVEEFWFESSSYNAAGLSVSVTAYAGVGRPDYAAWKASAGHPRPFAGVAAGELGQIGGGSWKQWNVADPATRLTVTDQISTALKTTGFEFFDLVETPDRLVAEMVKRWVPEVQLDNAVDYLVFLGRPDDAAAVVRAQMARMAKPWGTGLLADRLPEALHRWGIEVDLAPAAETNQLDAKAHEERREDAILKEFGFGVDRGDAARDIRRR